MNRNTMTGKRRSQALPLALRLFLLSISLFCLTVCRNQPVSTTIKIDGNGTGRTFEGIGGVSAGASSRLLVDYAEPYRSQILDYLFKPNYGASLQHLKVEVGSDVNSTDGSEPSHMRSRKDEDYTRGYEWWLMKEAKARNPKIMLDILPWGAPGWIGNGKYYSQDMADYMVKFIQGAKKQYGLDIDYAGIWNETDYDAGYIKLLRKTLDAHGLGTKIVAADLYENQWMLTSDFKRDPEVKKAVYALTGHYARVKGNVYITGGAISSGKPIWSSEDQPFDSTGDILSRDWVPGGRIWAQFLNTNYIDGKITKTETWSPVTSYYDILAAPHSGLMYANTPWSGHYDVQSAIWVTAHTTQFAQPGWQFIDTACGYLTGKGSYVTLKSPTGGDYSVIVETIDAKAPQLAEFRTSGNLSSGVVHVWQTNARQTFEHVSDITPENGSFRLTLDPDSVYSLTTTTGQAKGTATPPAAAAFPFPYRETFDTTELGRSPRFMADQDGAFEAQPCTLRQGRCLRQLITQKPIPWDPVPDPFTLLGSSDWKDYTVSSDVLLPGAGDVTLIGRIETGDVFQDGKARWPGGYILDVLQNGQWELNMSKYKAATVKLASGQVTFPSKAWHHLELSFQGSVIQASIDGVAVAKVNDSTYTHGMAAMGSGWNVAEFDNFEVR
ncbi:MAG TPA: family 16 glycoside hydrolase [Terriglobia bacterium]|nr:family 16 glycoside hydrolase [Terriglobia bacterium]